MNTFCLTFCVLLLNRMISELFVHVLFFLTYIKKQAPENDSINSPLIHLKTPQITNNSKF
jgi:hypothetical protein